MEKETYIAPQMEVIEIESVEMMATSLVFNEEGGNEESLSNGRRGKWGDLWYQGEEE